MQTMISSSRSLLIFPLIESNVFMNFRKSRNISLDHMSGNYIFGLCLSFSFVYALLTY